MGLVRFDIVLDQAKLESAPVFFAGQPITGSVVVWLQEKEKICDFFLEAEGRAKVHYSEGGENGSTYNANERYFRTRVSLAHHAVGDRLQLQAGHHHYPFVFPLPDEIPSSFDGKYGAVKYKLTAVIKRSWYKPDYVCEMPITVCSTLDLNTRLEEALAVPTKTECKDFMGLTLAGQITALAWLDRTGYVPGETILFNAKIENRSGSTVDATTVQLIKRETHMAQGLKFPHKKVLFKADRGKFRDGSTMCWDNFPIPVPNVPPSGLPHCNIIDIEYEIKLIVDPGLLSSNLVVSLGVLIGTVPIRRIVPGPFDGGLVPHSSSAQFPADCSGSEEKADGLDNPPATLGAMANLSIDPSFSDQLTPEAAPPSYDECVNSDLGAVNTSF